MSNFNDKLLDLEARIDVIESKIAKLIKNVDSFQKDLQLLKKEFQETIFEVGKMIGGLSRKIT